MRNLLMLLAVVACTLAGHAITVQNTAGSLSSLVPDHSITQLTVTGTMDASDFLFISETLTELTAVDLSQVTIVPYEKGLALYGTVTHYGENEIPRTAFFGKKITSVSLPATVQVIGYAAFAGCDRLATVTIPESVTFIDDYAFSGSGLTSVTLTSAVAHMGKGVFSRCESLTRADIDSKYVGDFAFLGDVALSEVNLGSNVEYVFKGVFNGCRALSAINMDPACRLTRIDDEAFINSGLSSIDLTGQSRLGTIGAWALAQTQLSAIQLADGMTVLGEGALSHNPLLTSVSLPGLGHNHGGGRGGSMAPSQGRTIALIEDYTFAGDGMLNASTLLKKGVARVGAYALYNVSAPIDTMVLPATLTYLGDRAMAGMTGMAVLKTAAADVPELGEEVWAGLDQHSIPLIVPDNESAVLYKAADQWMEFFFDAEDDYLLGDVNGDGVVNISDVTSLIDMLLSDSGGSYLKPADINGDGVINISDVTALIDMLLSDTSSRSLSRIRALVAEQCVVTSDALSLTPITIKAGETINVDVALNNTEHIYTALQCELVLPQGLRLVGVKGVDRGAAHDYYSMAHQDDPCLYTIIGASMQMDPYAGSEGHVMRLIVEADDDFSPDGAEVALANVELVTLQHETYMAGDAMVRVNDGSGVEKIVEGREIATVRYINVAGQQSDSPFDGINIVVTTYTDGTTAVNKVIR